MVMIYFDLDEIFALINPLQNKVILSDNINVP